jgi:hypothetical protein
LSTTWLFLVYRIPREPSAGRVFVWRKLHQLTDPILIRIARVIDEADTVQEVNIEPAAAGLDLICEGLRLVSNSDVEAVEFGRLVYDALYARLSQGTGEPK